MTTSRTRIAAAVWVALSIGTTTWLHVWLSRYEPSEGMVVLPAIIGYSMLLGGLTLGHAVRRWFMART